MASLMQLLVLGALLSFNEAMTIITGSMRSGLGDLSTRSSTRVKSKAEITASMTPESAAKILRNLNATPRAEFMTLIQRQYGDAKNAPEVQGTKTLMMLGANSFAKGAGSTKEIDAATKKLNEMLEETTTALEAEQLRCKGEDERQRHAMEQLRDAVADFNAAASGARAKVINAQGLIAEIGQRITKTREEYDMLLEDCEKDKRALQEQLEIVRADMAAMDQVMVAIGECDDTVGKPADGQIPEYGTMLQTPKAVMKHFAGRFQSDVAREVFQETMALDNGKSEKAATAQDDELSMADDEVDDDAFHPKAPDAQDSSEAHAAGEIYTEDRDTDDDDRDLSLLQRGKNRRIRRHRNEPDFSEGEGLETTALPVVPLSTQAPPTDPPAMDCGTNNKCSLASNPNCQVIKDRFLLVQTEIVEKATELEQEEKQKIEYCTNEEKSMSDQLRNMEARVATERTNLATATEEQNTAEANSRVVAQQHKSSATEYGRTVQECCANQNNAKSELCALEKVRGEVNKLKGIKTFTVDCDVSGWDAEPCPVTCGGGIRKSRRNVVTHAQYAGKACPPLEKVEACGEDPCPQNCQVTEWSGWSDCSSDCSGGVRERQRDVAVHTSNGGLPCAHTEEIDSCGFGSCNVACDLKQWDEWQACSKACGGGAQRRTRGVKTPAKGTGECQAEDHSDRLQFKECNTGSCRDLLWQLRAENSSAAGRYFHCNNKIDVTILMDSSGSLGWYGWWRSKEIAKTLVEQLPKNATDADIRMSVLKFSGPKDINEWKECTQSSAGLSEADMINKCRIKWVPTGDTTDGNERFTSDGQKLGAEVEKEEFFRKATLTSAALGEAEANLKNGRSDAASVVVVITDGRPLSLENTVAASKRLQSVAKVLWVPIGRRAPRKLIKRMASKPRGDHVISVTSFWEIREEYAFDNLINKITTSVCQDVVV